MFYSIILFMMSTYNIDYQFKEKVKTQISNKIISDSFSLCGNLPRKERKRNMSHLFKGDQKWQIHYCKEQKTVFGKWTPFQTTVTEQSYSLKNTLLWSVCCTTETL